MEEQLFQDYNMIILKVNIVEYIYNMNNIVSYIYGETILNIGNRADIDLSQKSNCYILTFDPAQNAIQGDASEGSDTFQWQLGEEIAGGGNWLTKWDKLKNPMILSQTDALEESDL